MKGSFSRFDMETPRLERPTFKNRSATANAINTFSFFTVNGNMTRQRSLALADPSKIRVVSMAGVSQFGDGTAANKSSPVQIGTLNGWRRAGLGRHTMITKNA